MGRIAAEPVVARMADDHAFQDFALESTVANLVRIDSASLSDVLPPAVSLARAHDLSS